MKKITTPGSTQPPHEASEQALLPFQETMKRVNVEELARKIAEIISDFPILNDELIQRRQDKFDADNNRKKP